MSKSLKFPDLQSKFERALVATLGGSPMSGSQLLAEVERQADNFEMTSAELADLVANSANYFTRAKQNGVLVSHGRHRGYSLASGPEDATAPRAGDAAPSTARSAVFSGERGEGGPSLEADPQMGRNQQWESFLHLPASLVLARRFGARVLSLPKVADRGAKWGNPDMLMVRSSPLDTLGPFLRTKDIEVSEFRLVDDSPRAILASIELKFGLGRNRSAWFQAVAETAANSLWANEAWLVFAEPEGASEPLDSELLALARSAEIGILELALRDDDRSAFEPVEHRTAVTRPRLRVADMDPGQRIGLLTAAHGLLTDFQSEGTFLDEEGNANKARELLQQGLSNLGQQTGFVDRRLSEALEPMRRARPDVLRRLVEASLEQVTELVPFEGVWPAVENSIRESVVVAAAERLQRDVKDLRQASEGGSCENSSAAT